MSAPHAVEEGLIAANSALIPHEMAWIPTAILLLAYVFIAWERIPKVVIALIGASILLVTQLVTQAEALAFVDFNVIALLVGMMILVNILRKTGALEYIALLSAKVANGSGIKLMLIFAFVTAILSAFLDNVTSVILIGSVTVSIARQLRINPVPFLIAETLLSNIGGTATLIGDPPNIMIGSAANISFSDFLVHLAPIVVVIVPVALWTLARIYREELTLDDGARKRMLELSTDGCIKDKGLLIKSLIVFSAVIGGFLFHSQLGLEAGSIAIAGAAILLIFENEHDIWQDVEWTTIFFFIGLFIIVGAVEKVGTITWLAEQFIAFTKGDYNLMAMLLLWASGILSAIVDNIPYTATMIPLVKSLPTLNPEAYGGNLQPLWWSLALGACLGGNGTMIGATANVLVADMAERQGHPIRFVEFMKIGSLIMAQSLIIATVYLWLRYLA